MRILNTFIVVIFLVILSSNFVFAGDASKAAGLSILQSLGEAVRTSNQEALDSAYKSYAYETVKLLDSGQITNSQRGKLLRQKHAELFGPENPYEKEHWDYYEYLNYQRDTKGMSKQEAAYLLQKNQNELDAREAATQVTPPQEKKLDYKCAEVCKQSGFGYDYCDSRCSY